MNPARADSSTTPSAKPADSTTPTAADGSLRGREDSQATPSTTRMPNSPEPSSRSIPTIAASTTPGKVACVIAMVKKDSPRSTTCTPTTPHSGPHQQRLDQGAPRVVLCEEAHGAASTGTAPPPTPARPRRADERAAPTSAATA